MRSALLFDLDNTLIDRDAAYALYARELVAELTASENNTKLIDSIVRDDDNGIQPRERHCRFLAELLGDGKRDAEWFWRRQLERLPHFIEPDPRIHEMLSELSGGRRMAIVTNGSGANQRAKITAAQLETFFDVILVSEEFGAAKPDASIFEEALRRLSCVPAHAWMVGDRLDTDIAPAKRLGLSTAWVRRRGGLRHPDADLCLTSVLELRSHAL